MTQTALFWYLVIVLALGIILATMFITYKRIGRWRQAQEHKAEQIHARAHTDPMDEDVGGNLARVPEQDKATRNKTPRS
jgi:uncharacterized membrane protein affecting hemolysin expression